MCNFFQLFVINFPIGGFGRSERVCVGEERRERKNSAKLRKRLLVFSVFQFFLYFQSQAFDSALDGGPAPNGGRCWAGAGK